MCSVFTFVQHIETAVHASLHAGYVTMHYHAFVEACLLLQNNFFFSKKSFMNTIWVSNGVDSDHNRPSVSKNKIYTIVKGK